jgi:hypothetical protein
MSKENKVMDLKKVEALMNLSTPITPRRYMCLMGWHNFIGVLLKKLLQSCHQS